MRTEKKGMGKKKSVCVAQRGWSLLRMALIWARKGGALKGVLWPVIELRSLVPKCLKGLTNGLRHGNSDRYLFRYGERELSFDKTPILHVKMHRPTSMMSLLSCITPQTTDFDYDSDSQDSRDGGWYGYGDRYLEYFTEECIDGVEEEGEEEEEEEKGIDVRAEEFIAKFYEQMKMQRQISYLQYRESNSKEQ